MDYDAALKEVVSEILTLTFPKAGLKPPVKEFGIETIKLRADLMLAELGEPIGKLAENSWLFFLFKRAKKINLFEFKGPREVISEEHIWQTLSYKLLYSLSTKTRFEDVSVFLVGFKVKKNLDLSQISNHLRLEGALGFYVIAGDPALEVNIIVVDELNPSIPGNDALCVFSQNEKTSLEAAKSIIGRYSKDTFIFAITILIRPEVIPLEKSPEIPKERLAKAVEIIGIERLADALGPERLAKAVEVIGIERLADALGPERLEKLVVGLLSKMPPEKRRKVLKRFSDGSS